MEGALKSAGWTHLLVIDFSLWMETWWSYVETVNTAQHTHWKQQRAAKNVGTTIRFEGQIIFECHIDFWINLSLTSHLACSYSH